MKKLFLSILLTFMLIPSFVYAQVKQYVGIVRQQYYSEYVDIFKNMSKELKSEGYNTYSKAIDSYLEGGFGSGFVWVAKDGTNYIVTNRHVVANAETVSVEFEDDETGEITKYEGLRIVATDDDIDIAILAFKNGERPFAKGLEFSEAALRDGQEVWSAGFPALGDEPVWQFGKGTVTNSRARIKELLNPEISTIIQHSAQVDYGNSGGPLLISSGGKYLVVGINTWKAAYRDSANFAIPAAQIKKMINSISSGSSSSAKDRAFKLAQALGDSSQKYTSIINFISFHKASVDGQKDFESVLRFAPTSVRSTVSEVFNSNPAEGLRYACAYQLFKKYGSTEDK
ncbi:MAG: trypsin-like peptidase domain-containing protein, partial [Treponema sp.]|nr:trypsin-like peptidase domain-containing protein [Treponema sp.]